MPTLMGAARQTSASSQIRSETSAKSRCGKMCAIQSADHLHRGDQNQEENLAVDARLDHVAADPAVEAQIDEGRERPDLLLFDEAANGAGGETKQQC